MDFIFIKLAKTWNVLLYSHKKKLSQSFIQLRYHSMWHFHVMICIYIRKSNICQNINGLVVLFSSYTSTNHIALYTRWGVFSSCIRVFGFLHFIPPHKASHLSTYMPTLQAIWDSKWFIKNLASIILMFCEHWHMHA